MNLTLEHLNTLGPSPARNVCGAVYLPTYRDPGYSDAGHDLDEIKAELLALPWLTKRTARHEYFMADKVRSYTYGNHLDTHREAERHRWMAISTEAAQLDDTARRARAEELFPSVTYASSPFTPHVEHLMNHLNRDLGTEFNVCFLDKYDDQHQHLGWHADDFPGMQADQPIAVVSFGAEREIWLKDKRGFQCEDCGRGSPDGCATCDDTGFTKAPPHSRQPADQRIKLEEGFLFIMPPGYQDTHLHRIPKHDRPCGWRISLTFRSFA